MEFTQYPRYNEDDFKAFIPFTNEKDHCFTKQVRLNILVPKYHGYRGPKPTYWHNPPMDTGSTGLAISAWDLGYTKEEQLQEYEKGKAYLSSSGVYYEGYWLPTRVTFPDGNVVAEVKILAVTLARICLEFNETTGSCDLFSDENRGCRRSHFPPEICYLGVGFGRLSTQKPGATADMNPFLNVIETRDGMAISRTSIRRGYVITETGVWLGLAKSNTKDFHYTKLSPNPHVTSPAEPREWSSANVFINYHKYHNMPGTALFDTGIEKCYLSGPLFKSIHVLSQGEQFTIKIGDRADMPIETLHITVDDFTNPITPACVRASPREVGFVNTGRFFYRCFELLFDAEDGWLGLRRRELCGHPGINRPLESRPSERSSRPGAERRDSDDRSHSDQRTLVNQ